MEIEIKRMPRKLYAASSHSRPYFTIDFENEKGDCNP